MKKRLSISGFTNFEKAKIRSVAKIRDLERYMITVNELKRKGYDPDLILLPIVSDAMDHLLKMTGVKRFMDETGVRMVTEYIIDHYDNFALADINVFTYKIIIGEFGEDYENISASKIMKWIGLYSNIRANERCEYMQRLDREEQKIDQNEIDPNGLRRMADSFGKVFKKHLENEAAKQPAYLRMDEYIERNGLDRDELMKKLEDGFKVWISEILKSGQYENVESIDDIPDEIRSAYFKQYKDLFLIEENKKLK